MPCGQPGAAAAPWSEPKRPRRSWTGWAVRRIADGPRHTTSRLWRQAEGLWDQAMAAERAWKLTRSAFEFFTPEAASTIGNRPRRLWRRPAPLSGPASAKTRRLLLRRESSRSWTKHNGVWLSWDWTPTSCRPCWTWKAAAQSLATVGVNAQLSRDTGLALARTVQLAKAEPHWQDLAGRFVRYCVECACQQPGGMHQQRGADASRAAPQDDAGLLDLKRCPGTFTSSGSGHRKNQRRTACWA